MEKYKFFKTEITFLSFRVERDGVSMKASKCEAVKDWPKPTNVKEVQEFLGFCNFYRSLIKGYSDKSSALSDLTKKDQKWEFGPTQEECFKELKKEFDPKRIIVTHNPERPGIVEADASDKAIGAVYSQIEEDGKLRPVAFFSKKLLLAELNYEIHDKELLAIVRAMEEWKHYLEGAKHKVQILTNYQNLLYFTTTK